MPEFRAPGVYIEEIAGPQGITGVETSTAAFLGEAERGVCLPQRITSAAEFSRLYGRRVAGRHLADAVNGFFLNGGRQLVICRIAGRTSQTAHLRLGAYLMEANGPGEWGNRLWVRLERIADTFRLRIALLPPQATDSPLADPFDNLRPVPAFEMLEEFTDIAPSGEGGDSFEDRLMASSLVVVSRVPGAVDGLPQFLSAPLRAGTTVPAASADFEGDAKSGLIALRDGDFDDVALLHAPYPSRDAIEVARVLIADCERSKTRFAVIDSPPEIPLIREYDPRIDVADTGYAAFYYPWIEVADDAAGATRTIPPGGYVLGVYARTDAQEGVFRSPVDTVVGALRLSANINDGLQGILNPVGINAIRAFQGLGIRVWGARTLSTEPDWKYVSVRRFLIFLEHSMNEGLQWVVFEPNDERLWARVRDTIRLFLRSQWMIGGLAGPTEDNAFFVVCDRTTMTQDDIDNGRLIVTIGMAVTNPAEFVVITISQLAGHPDP
ncbi:MAG TPA: phage tail sheath C-terminal domain-containing protein [Mesorhizobium sp.]